MYVYRLSPIDFWQGWHRAQDLLRIDPRPGAEGWEQDCPVDPSSWFQKWQNAQAFARELGWPGDIRPGCGPFVSMIPMGNDASECDYLIAWKEDNNGTTYVASPVPLPHLAEEDRGFGLNWVGSPTPLRLVAK